MPTNLILDIAGTFYGFGMSFGRSAIGYFRNVSSEAKAVSDKFHAGFDAQVSGDAFNDDTQVSGGGVAIAIEHSVQ